VAWLILAYNTIVLLCYVAIEGKKKMTSPAFETLWEALAPTLTPQWDMTLRIFTLQHPQYPNIRVEAASEALVVQAFRNALLKLLA
jgi:hypothetical protein